MTLLHHPGAARALLILYAFLNSSRFNSGRLLPLFHQFLISFFLHLILKFATALLIPYFGPIVLGNHFIVEQSGTSDGRPYKFSSLFLETPYLILNVDKSQTDPNEGTPHHSRTAPN